MDEVNPYARNVIVVSSAFVLFVVLGLSPAMTNGSADLNILSVRFDVQRTEMLPWVAYAVLAYTIWKFEVTIKDFAPKQDGLDLSSQIRNSIRPILTRVLRKKGLRYKYLQWLAERSYNEQEVTQTDYPYDGVRHKYDISEENELRFSCEVASDSTTTFVIDASIAPIEILNNDNLSDGQRKLVDRFKVRIGLPKSAPIVVQGYISFFLFSPAFHSLIVPRLLYGSAILCAVYERYF